MFKKRERKQRKDREKLIFDRQAIQSKNRVNKGQKKNQTLYGKTVLKN